MTTSIESSTRSRRAVAGVILACVPSLSGCATESPDYRNQQTFATPHAAVESLLTAARSADAAELEGMFGDGAGEVLMSGDPVMDRRQREVFVVVMDEGWSLERIDGGTRELIVGHEHWPFPIPLVKDARGWWFDTAAGEMEVLARRIGRNELAVIGILRTYVFAQRTYASEGRDGRPAGIFAQKLRSDPDRHNGLYWRADAPGERPSPLSELAAEAAVEGYSDDPGRGSTPFHGYLFRILTRQGEHAPGGAANYVVDGEMTGGFAAIAYPAEYGNSGIMTFLVGADGIVYESDLGEGTSSVAAGIEEFDPGTDWRAVE